MFIVTVPVAPAATAATPVPAGVASEKPGAMKEGHEADKKRRFRCRILWDQGNSSLEKDPRADRHKKHTSCSNTPTRNSLEAGSKDRAKLENMTFMQKHPYDKHDLRVFTTGTCKGLKPPAAVTLRPQMASAILKDTTFLFKNPHAIGRSL